MFRLYVSLHTSSCIDLSRALVLRTIKTNLPLIANKGFIGVSADELYGCCISLIRITYKLDLDDDNKGFIVYLIIWI